LRERYDKVGVEDKGSVFNTDLLFHIELGYMLDCADMIATSAIERKESRGAHTRLDFPKTDSGYWETVNSCAKYVDGQVNVGVIPKPEMPAELKAIVAAGS